MTIKISQLANLAVVQANTVIPVVSNITGTLTTVKGNVEQLQTYMLENAGNLIPAAGNIYSIGNSTTWWKDLWLSANTLYIGGVPIGTAGGELTFGGNAVGTSGLDTYTGNVSAGNIAVGATTVGNTTTAPTFSVEGSTGNITAGNISAGNITSTGDFGAASVSTPTVSSNTVNCGAGGVNFIQGAVDSVTLTNAGTEKGGSSSVIYPTGGTGTGFAIVIKEVSGPSDAISVWEVYNPGQGYTAGDELTIETLLGINAEFIINAVNDVGTLTAGDSTWSFDPTGDTTIPGNISLPDNTAIYNEDASTAVFTSNIVSDATSIYLTDAGNAAVYASDSVVLETNSDGNVSQQWSFNNSGDITFPDATTQSTAFSNTAPIITTLNNNITQANIAMKGYVDNSNVAMQGYVDNQAYSNAKVSSYLLTYSGNIGQSLQVGGNVTYIYNPLSIGFPPAIFYANTVLAGTNSADGYVQLNIQNINTVGNLVSADFIATAPNGTDTTHYIDMGINGNNWSSGSWTVSGPNDGYVYINQGNLTLGTDTADTTVKVHVGGTLENDVVATFSQSNVTICGNLIVCNVYVPTANNSVGTKGQISYDNNYVYICIADNNWRRANISTW